MKSSKKGLLSGTFAGTAAALLPLAGAISMAHAQQGVQLEEIIVTATRREESIRDVPVSISAFSQEAMDRQGIREIGDIARLTPGVAFSKFGGLGSQISIRGITSDAGAATVGIYIDDTPIQVRATSSSGNFSANSYPQIFDLERVEVLRGPQGTLFGAGSEGGTIRFITPTPSLDEYSVYGRSELGFTSSGAESYEAGIAGGGPLVDDLLGFRASLRYRRDGGYVDHVDYLSGRVDNADANQQDTTSARLALKWQATDRLSLTPSVLYQDISLDNTSSVWLPVNNAASPAEVANQFLYTNLSSNRFGHGSRLAQPIDQEMTLSALKIEFEGDGFDIISNTSYFDRTEAGRGDFTQFESALWTTVLRYVVNLPIPVVTVPLNPLDEAPAYDNQENEYFTQEVRIQSNGDSRLSWVAGVFYSKNETRTFRSVTNNFLGPLLSANFGCAPNDCIAGFVGGGVPLYQDQYMFVGNVIANDEQIAGFGQVDFALTDHWTLTAGLRVAQVDFDFTNFAAGPVNGPPSPRTDRGKSSETPVTPKVGVAYQQDNGNLYYFNVSEGFRVGGANVPLPTVACDAGLQALGFDDVPAEYDSDKVRSYELGGKVTLAEGRVLIDASAFYVEWQDRISNLAIPGPGCFGSFTTNLGDVTSIGYDIVARVMPMDGLELGLAIGEAEATLDKDFSISGVGITASKGDAVPFGSRRTATLSAQYDFNLMDLDSYLRADYTYTGKNDRTPNQNPANTSYDPEAETTPSSKVLNARVGAYIGNWDVSLFVNNLTDENYIVGTGSLGGASSVEGGFVGFRPRTAGITATFRY